MRTENLRSIPVKAEASHSEDAYAASLLGAARRYSLSRSEHDLAAIFFEVTAPFVTGLPLGLRIRCPADRVVRAFGHGDADAPSVANQVQRDALDDAALDTEGWLVVDERSCLVDVAGVHDDALVAVVSIPDATDEATLRRLGRFVEQLAGSVAELAERSETARLRLYAGSIVDRTNVPIAVVDGRGVVQLSNDALRAALGGSLGELAPSSILDRVGAVDRNRALVAHARALRGQSTVGVELAIATSATEESRMLVDFEPIPLPNGEVASVLVVGRDVTRVRQLEDQITHADRLATLGQLAAGVVHELNNPLTSILVYTEYLLRKAESGPEGDGDTEKLRRILGAAGRIQDFAKNLVAYSRAERGDREALSVAAVLDQAVAFCEPLIDRKRVHIIRHYEDAPELPAVRGQLHQIFINLITNAVQAIAESTGRIVVSLGTDAAGWVALRFDDNGPGIPEEKREDIFRPFVTTKPTGQGTGLGLSIVRNLVERHGGTITVGRSSLGGASFSLGFPLKPPSEPPPPAHLFSE